MITEIDTPWGSIPIDFDRFSDDRLGEYDDTNYTITIHDGINERAQYETLMHELVHNVLFRTGTSNLFGLDINEMLADLMSHYFIYIIRNNPKLIKQIQRVKHG